MIPDEVFPDDVPEGFKVTETFYGQILAFENSILQIGHDQDFEQHIPFDSSRHPDCAYGSMYMVSSSPPPVIRSFDRKHWKKKLRQHSGLIKPNKFDLISPLPYYQMKSSQVEARQVEACQVETRQFEARVVEASEVEAS